MKRYKMDNLEDIDGLSIVMDGKWDGHYLTTLIKINTKMFKISIGKDDRNNEKSSAFIFIEGWKEFINLDEIGFCYSDYCRRVGKYTIDYSSDSKTRIDLAYFSTVELAKILAESFKAEMFDCLPKLKPLKSMN